MARPFEAYYDDDEVRAEQASVLFGMAPPFLLALGVLQLAQLFPAVRLARRILQDNVRSLRGHFGLRVMEDAIGEAGGTLQVMSASGRGTTVIARFGAANDAVLRGVPQPVP